MSQPIDFDISIQRYQGPKKVPMPDNCAKICVQPLKVICSCIIAERRAKELDFSFLNAINSDDNCPEFNGFNTSVARVQGQALKPKTQAVYLPLIDIMMTALHEAKRLIKRKRSDKSGLYQ
jgi:hypothetical protein